MLAWSIERRRDAAVGGAGFWALIRNSPELLLALLVARSSLVVLASSAARLIGIPSIIGVASVAVVIIIIGLLAVRVIWQRLGRRAWVFIWFMACGLLLALIRSPHARGYHTVIAQDIVVGLIWFAVAFSVRDFRRLRSLLYVSAFAILAAGVIQLLQFAATPDRTSYSQYLAYVLLPAALIFIDAAFDRRVLVNTALAMMTAALLISSGARGPFVVMLLFLVIRILLQVGESPAAGVSWAAATLAVSAYAQSRFDELVVIFFSWLEALGLSTRVVSRMMEGVLLEDHARQSLARYTIEIVQQNPFLGVGISNERPLLAEAMGRSPQEAIGWYPHNFFLEVWAQHGIILGSILILFLAAGILSQLLSGQDPNRGAVLLLFVGFGFLPLMFSASYLNWPSFFALVGISLVGMSRGKSKSQDRPGPKHSTKSTTTTQRAD